jgi:hypothetical protein
MKLYIYANLLAKCLSSTEVNFWAGKKYQETGLYSDGNTVAFQLIEVREIDLSNINFDFVTGKIQALELQLGDLHVKSENIKQQIQELKCIGHETPTEREERMKDKILGDEDHFHQFDDGIPF